MHKPDLIKLDALDYLWRSLRTSPDFETSRDRFSKAFGALVMAELASLLDAGRSADPAPGRAPTV